MLMVAQDQALRTNTIKGQLTNRVSPLCRLCREKEETISYVVAQRKMLTQNKYHLQQHDRHGVVFNWVMRKRYEFLTGTK